MNVIAKHNDQLILAIGDIHRDYYLLKNKIEKYKLENFIGFASGDFGVGFGYNNPREPKKENKRLLMLNDFFKRKNSILYVVAGNHDNPCFFDGKHNFSNLIFMEDYDVVEVGEHTILGVGGATSVDRKPNGNFLDMYGRPHMGRKEGVNWWPGEKVVYNEEKIKTLVGIDVVIAHTAPDFVYPNVLNEYILKWIEYDPSLESELLEERATMTRIYNKLSELNYLKQFVYGHFHRSNCERHELTKFKLLDIGEIYEIILE
jgi:UDP-2,3-diacylglucosamine pyrophosphatase LpxH